MVGQAFSLPEPAFRAVVRGGSALRLFHQVLDVVFKDEQIGFAVAGDADEALIVILDGALDFFAVHHLDAHQRRAFNQLFEILDLFKGLLRRACGFS